VREYRLQAAEDLPRAGSFSRLLDRVVTSSSVRTSEYRGFDSFHGAGAGAVENKRCGPLVYARRIATCANHPVFQSSDQSLYVAISRGRSALAQKAISHRNAVDLPTT